MAELYLLALVFVYPYSYLQGSDGSPVGSHDYGLLLWVLEVLLCAIKMGIYAYGDISV